ncbi:MacS family sensor histidine kinase [Plantactinospora siamensis]|uniref:MacS family sensor histidine kinase n=1 Tax=Plantactinospora siamensis TaxID=555372 RepID=A0ABV6NTF3_9ACTN
MVGWGWQRRVDPRPGPEADDVPLWRAIAVFRLGALLYVGLTAVVNLRSYRHPWLMWAELALMGVWTAAAIAGYATSRRRGPLLGTDLAVVLGCLLLTPLAAGAAAMGPGRPPVPPSAWMAGPVLAWAVAGGRRPAVAAALLIGAADVATHHRLTQTTLNGPVLLLLAGLGMGQLTRLIVDARQRLRQAVELDAATRERERLARGIHDSVLQVLALVQRRGAEIGGPAAELGRLAGAQEAALRELVAGRAPSAPAGGADLRAELGRYAAPDVSLSAPAEPVTLPAGAATAIAAATGAALDNVRRHCGPDARAWVLVEDEPDAVTVTIRDEGPGIPSGRLARAAADGRIGVAQSIRGRIRDAGGIVTITSTPGQGTEIELRVPRARPPVR